MKKLLILGFTKLAYMPYMNFYLEALKGEEVEVHVVSWRRDEEPDVPMEDTSITVHEFKCAQLDEVAKIKKISSFLKYRAFVKAVLKKTSFDRIIVLHTLPAVLVADILLAKYRNKFILDYRDYTYEGFLPFKKLIGSLTKASYATFVSSDAFRECLPKLEKVHTSHNLLVDSLQHRDVRDSKEREHKPIRMAFWGFIRHEEINAEIIRKLGNDPRFELHYYGREQQTALNLKQLVRGENYANVVFHGSYQPIDRYAFAAETDLLHNIYENDETMGRAMPNKYYDGIVFRIPQVCMTGSYMGQRVTKDGVGAVLNPYDSGFVDELATYYDKIDWRLFDQACNKATAQIFEEYQKGKETIRGLVGCQNKY